MNRRVRVDMPRDVLHSTDSIYLLDQKRLKAKLLISSLDCILVGSKKVNNFFAVNENELPGVISPLINICFVRFQFHLKSHDRHPQFLV
jgi:hypothetical protein